MKFVILILSLICACQAKPVMEPSYIQQINVSYENELWICGTIHCPAAETYGCHVQMFNDKSNKQFLNTVYTCIDESKNGIVSSGDTEEMQKIKTINVDLWSYVGAVSVYSTGYVLGGHEYANGIVAPNGWEELKKYAENNQKTVEESNSLIKNSEISK